jgi:hypothetical protein
MGSFMVHAVFHKQRQHLMAINGLKLLHLMGEPSSISLSHLIKCNCLAFHTLPLSCVDEITFGFYANCHHIASHIDNDKVLAIEGFDWQ